MQSHSSGSALPGNQPPANSRGTVLFASLIGTTIEFFDFYIYATAAALVFPTLFFPPGDATAATLQSLATFAIAFFARLKITETPAFQKVLEKNERVKVPVVTVFREHGLMLVLGACAAEGFDAKVRKTRTVW